MKLHHQMLKLFKMHFFKYLLQLAQKDINLLQFFVKFLQFLNLQ